MIIYILKSEDSDEESEWCNGLGVDNKMLWETSDILSSTEFNPDCDIKLEIWPV